MKKAIFLFCCGLLTAFVPYARTGDDPFAGARRLSLAQALDLALQQSFDIGLARNDWEQGKINNTWGNAGALPNLNATGGYNASLSNTRMELAGGQVQDRPNALSRGLSGGVQLDWTLFDGMRMFINKERLDRAESMGLLALKQQVQRTVAQTIVAYANVLRQKHQLVALDTAMALAKERMDLAGKQFEIGTSAKTDYLQAKVDYNASRSARLSQMALLYTAMDSLSVLMGTEPNTVYTVDDSLHIDNGLVFEDKGLWIERNLALSLAREQQELLALDYKWAKGQQWPSVDLRAAYNYNRTTSDAGFALFNRSAGPQASLNLSLPLFNGFNIQRQKKLAKWELERQGIVIDKTSASVVSRYRSMWNDYKNALERLELERDNLTYARENATIQQARFRVGISNALELREAENSYVAALSRLIDAGYAAKVAETSLLELQQRLVKE